MEVSLNTNREIKASELRLRFASNLEYLRATVALFPPGRDTACVLMKIDEAEMWASRAMPPAEEAPDTRHFRSPDDPRGRSA